MWKKKQPNAVGKRIGVVPKQTFYRAIIETVLPIWENIQLITNTNDCDCLAYKKIKDIVVDKGPLGGIFTVLVHSEIEKNLILSCDIPLISTEILSEQIEKHGTNFDVSVFKDIDRMHPLIEMYSKKNSAYFKKGN